MPKQSTFKLKRRATELSGSRGLSKRNAKAFAAELFGNPGSLTVICAALAVSMQSHTADQS